MTLSTRRTFAKLGLVALPGIAAVRDLAAAAQLQSVFNGVRLGIGSYSFRGFKLDDIVSGLAAVPMGELELESWFVEPGVSAAGRGGLNPEQREALRQWRLTAPLDEVRAVKAKCDNAGIHIYAYNIPIDDSFTEAEIDRVFQMAQAMGVGILNVVSTLPVAERLIAPSAKYKMRVGFHPSGNLQNPNAIGTGDSWRKVIALAPNFGVCPDLGGRANWGADPLAFLREMKDRLTTLHTHDQAPFGQGQAPVKEILLMIRNEKFTFVPIIERIYRLTPEMDNVAELRKLVGYCRDVLAQG
jgi:sugar phosphate isomerase/epimerase